MESVRFKLVTANEVELFEQRMNAFVDSLDRGDLIVDVEFATTQLASGGLEFSALVRFQRTESWS
ncbi:MAG: hypothetical protein WD314_10950 [Trueperaceae bacterium]